MISAFSQGIKELLSQAINKFEIFNLFKYLNQKDKINLLKKNLKNAKKLAIKEIIAGVIPGGLGFLLALSDKDEKISEKLLYIVSASLLIHATYHYQKVSKDTLFTLERLEAPKKKNKEKQRDASINRFSLFNSKTTKIDNDTVLPEKKLLRNSSP